MAKGIDRLLLGGALAVGGLLHHRVGQVGTRVSDIETVVHDQAEQQTQAVAPPPGMPLPTGYGLQVRGPAGEDILIPVCLPPGFELDSMVLRPAFLPNDERRPAPVHVAPPAPAPVLTPEPAPVAAPTRDRLVEALQLVYSEPPSYQTQAEGVHAPGRRMVDALDRLDRQDRIERIERDLSVL